MGVCQTKVKKNKNTKKANNNRESKVLHTDFVIKSDTHIKLPRLNSQERLNSPKTCMLSQRKKTRVGVRMLTTQIFNSSRSIQGTVFEMNATKKYSLIKQINEVSISLSQDFSLMQNNKTGKLVMLQTLCKSVEQNTKFVEWLQSIELDHPNILRMIEIFQDQYQYQVIYEHFNGQPLSCLIGDKIKLQKKQLASILQQIMEALNYLHSLNIIHGNLTLDSIQYQEKNNGIIIQLINLKAIIYKDEENLDVKLLTPPWLIYHPSIVIQRDIWAIGMIALALRNGKFPIDINRNIGMDKIQQKIKLFECDFTSIGDPIESSFLELILSNHTERKLDFFLSHEFIASNTTVKLKPQTQLLRNSITSKPCCLLQQFIFEYFVKEFNWEEYLKIEKLFYEGDSNMDGFLCKEDFVRLFHSYSELENYTEIVDKLFKTHEFADNMLINNALFLTLTANREELLTKSNIEICFEIFSNNKQVITLRGLRRHLNADSEELAKQVSSLIGDQKTLNFVQFSKLMEMML